MKAGTISKQDAKNQIATVKDTLPDQPQDRGANAGKVPGKSVPSGEESAPNNAPGATKNTGVGEKTDTEKAKPDRKAGGAYTWP